MEREQALKFVNDLLLLTRTRNGSALFLTAEFPPAIKVHGKVTKVSTQSLTSEHTLSLARAVMNDRQAAEFERAKVCNLAISSAGFGRFRVSAFFQQGQVALVCRPMPQRLPTIEGLNLPSVQKEIALARRGLVIAAGAPGSGRSTSLAAMVDWRNEHSQGHILTIEDAIEFVHPHKNCIVTQREVGVDADSWDEALHSALRQAPDVVVIGDIRGPESLSRAIAFAEEGYLCMASLNANGAPAALECIVNSFPVERRAQVQMDLSLNLKALIAQRLVPRQDGRGRIAAVEVLLNSPYISDLIAKGEIGEIGEAMRRSRDAGMQTLDQALFDLYDSHQISYEDALRNAASVNDLRLHIKLRSARSRTTDLAAGIEHLALVGGESPPAAAPIEDSAVLLGASAPQALRPGDEFTARLVAYAPELEDTVVSLLRRLSPRSTPHMALKPCRWKVGAPFTVRLSATDLQVDDAIQVATWTGTHVLVEFDVTVPSTVTARTSVLKFDISMEGITVARLRLDVTIDEGVTLDASVEARAQASRSAFASYSREDRERVLDRVASARISAGLDIFLDCMSLNPSEAWKPRLEREIRERDLFLLFWSEHSARPDWVDWEWRTAYTHKGREAMQIHPLQSNVAPPDELKDLHFGDPLMWARAAQQ